MSIQTRTTAVQNEVVRLYFTFTNDGILADPASQPLVEILDADGVTLLDTANAVSENTGIWYVDWYVPANLPVGNYYDQWTWQWTASGTVQEAVVTFSVSSLDSYVNFISPDIASQVSDRAAQLMMCLSNDFIYEAMHIPVYWEQGMRVQQENQPKRVKTYYYFNLDNATAPYVLRGAVYSNNSQTFTVFEDLGSEYSSSSSSSESSANVSSSSSSSSSADSSSSSSSSSDGYSSSSSSSTSSHVPSSSSESTAYVTTTTTTTYVSTVILTASGTGDPLSSGDLTLVSGTGPATLSYSAVTKKRSNFSTIYNFAYENWNKDPRPIVRLNNRIVDDGWYSDYNGNLYMDGLLAPEDSVNVAYNFAYFSDEEILSFLQYGLCQMNATPPASETYSSLSNMPSTWDCGVCLAAAIQALRRLIFGLNFQEKMIIFGTPEMADKAINNFQSLLTAYTDLWVEFKKDVKTRKLPGIAQYVTPEYTLPGGRSRWFRYLYKSGN